jgi:quercetin dioxygenase-like cupin family protein
MGTRVMGTYAKDIVRTLKTRGWYDLPRMKNVSGATACFSSTDIGGDVAFFTESLGFRLESIFPADDPSIATISGHGLRIRLEQMTGAPAGVLRLSRAGRNRQVAESGPGEFTSPGGTRILLVDASPSANVPPTRHSFIVTRRSDEGGWVKGRAGMLYRDLIPGRLGGALIASHIRIPEAGPVPDFVHFHDVGLQLIFCHRGWVRLVYEDQGPPFVMKAGGCVLQPPGIRHRVLEASENLEVVELTTPAEHLTSMDHDMTLPTPLLRPEREFDGQRFCRSEAEDAVWGPWRLPGFESRDTGVGAASGGKAAMRVIRPTRSGGPKTIARSVAARHTADILFGFILEGRMMLRTADQGDHPLGPEDAFVIPPGMSTTFADASDDLQLLEITLATLGAG